MSMLEKIVVYATLVAMSAFVFTGVLVRPSAVLVGLMLLLVVLALKNIGWLRCACTQEEDGIDSRFFPILLSGLCVRIAIALMYCPRLVADCAKFWDGIKAWCVGDFIETKSYSLTLLYSIIQYVCGGPNLQLNQFINVALGVLQIWLTYDMASRLFHNRKAGIVGAALVAFHPAFIFMTVGLYAEPLFGVLVLLTFKMLLTVSEFISSGVSDRRVVVSSALLGFVGMSAFYCRGNGVFLFLAVGVAFLVFLSGPVTRKTVMMKVFCPCASVCIAMATTVGVCNIHMLGHFVVSSSEDSIWPVIVGTNVKTGGKWVVPCEDVKLIKSKFASAYPGEKFDLHKAVPIIKAEVSRRWCEHPWEMLKLSWRKYRDMWSGDEQWVAWQLNREDRAAHFEHWYILRSPMKLLKSAESLCMLLALTFLPVLKRPARLVVVAMCGFVLFNVANHLFIESAYRYSYPFILLLPVLCSGVVMCFKEKKRC